MLLQEANAEALPFVDESFDLVFCRTSLHHFADPQRAVNEMVRTCRPGGRVVLFDLVPPSADVRATFDHVHRLLDPSHVRTFLEPELAELLPGGIGGLTYGDTATLRLPIEVILTDQSDRDEVLALLQAEMRGDGEPTGFDPREEDGKIVVSFTTCVVHTTRAVDDLRRIFELFHEFEAHGAGASTKTIRRVPKLPLTTTGPYTTSWPSISRSRSSENSATCKKPSAGSSRSFSYSARVNSVRCNAPRCTSLRRPPCQSSGSVTSAAGVPVERNRLVEVTHLHCEVRYGRDRHAAILSKSGPEPGGNVNVRP